MNVQLIDAKRQAAVLEERDGKKVLVRQSLINYFHGICEEADHHLATIPALLKDYGLADLDTEAMQRSILEDGFRAVWDAVFDRTMAQMKEALFPNVRRELAEKNANSIPRGDELRRAIEDAVGSYRVAVEQLDRPLADADLVFHDGALHVPAEYVDAIGPRYTIPVSAEHENTVKKIRMAGEIIGELKVQGVAVSDEMRMAPNGQRPIQFPGLISRLAAGTTYTDAELLGLLAGIELTH